MTGWEIPRHWRLKKQRYGLVGETCPHCEHKIFPPRDICPNCGDEPRASIAGMVSAKTEEELKNAAAISLVVLENVG